MKCPNCNCHFEGKRCPNCNTRVFGTDKQKKPDSENSNLVEIKETHSFCLFGFRSKKVWKMVLSSLYMLFCGMMLLGCILASRTGSMPQKDHTIELITDIFILFLWFSPYIFLSDSPLRNILPLFKRKKPGSSFMGMFVILFAVFLTIGLIDGLHTPEYQADQENHAFVLTEETPASCVENGEKHYVCSYCGEEEYVEIAASHDYEKEVDEDGTIHYYCTQCGDTYTYTP